MDNLQCCVATIDLDRVELIFQSKNYFGEATVFIDEKDLKRFEFNEYGLVIEFTDELAYKQNCHKFAAPYRMSPTVLITENTMVLGVVKEGRYVNVCCFAARGETPSSVKWFFREGIEKYHEYCDYAVMRMENKEFATHYMELLEENGFYNYYTKGNKMIVDMKSFNKTFGETIYEELWAKPKDC